MRIYVTEFPTNSYVLQSYENDNKRPPHKLNTKLRGPHKVIARHIRPEGPDVYTLSFVILIHKWFLVGTNPT